MTQRYSTAVQQINNPKNPGFHGKFFFVGSIPAACYDQARNGGAGGSQIYDTEGAAIQAAIKAGAEVIQGADGRMIETTVDKFVLYTIVAYAMGDANAEAWWDAADAAEAAWFAARDMAAVARATAWAAEAALAAARDVQSAAVATADRRAP